ncbi:MAG: flagellar basal body P-ring formation chaperone FlgA [Candidatus Gastranaerophilales bacterium]|nr:flagellar basal body P-ring formation chaperone FlgA [Candidatus Gastranaerophilales bacterium]
MKKLLTTALIMIVTAVCANAQTVTSAEVKAQVAKQLQAGFTKIAKGDVEVKITATPFASIQLPDGNVTYKITQGGDKIIPRDIKRVDVYVNDAFVRTLNLPCQTIVYKEVLVANDFINREQAITKETVSVKKIDVSQKMDYVLSEQVLAKEMSAKKAFQKGEIIDKRFVKMKPDVERNMAVRIFFISNGAVMITIDGTALADGMTGDYINVENKNYKRVYTGKVIGENRVLVSI